MFLHLCEEVVAEVERGQLLRLEDGGRDGGVGQRVVAQVQGPQAGQLSHTVTQALHLCAVCSVQCAVCCVKCEV